MKKVKEQILKTTQEKADGIISEANKEKQLILKQVEKKLAVNSKSFESEIESYNQKTKDYLDTEISSYKKRKSLELETEIISKVFDKVLVELDKLSDKKRKEHIDLILKKIKEYPVLYCSSKDINLIKKSKSTKILGGLVLENKEGSQRIDLSYNTLVEDIKKEHISEVYDTLFKK